MRNPILTWLSHFINEHLEFRTLRYWWSRLRPPDALRVEQVAVTVPNWPRDFRGWRIAQLSDLHVGAYVGEAELRVAVDMVMRLRPDVIVITGDFVSRLSRDEAQTVSDELQRLSAPEGVFGILGNHDWWTDPDRVSEAATRAGVKMLRNANVMLQRGEDVLYLAGVDDVWARQHDLSFTLADVPREGRVLLLAHEPDYADEVKHDQRVVLQLSGHSHGGQIRLPILGPIVTKLRGWKYVMGLYRVGGLTLYVNRGIGAVMPGIRWNCPPEVTLLTIN